MSEEKKKLTYKLLGKHTAGSKDKDGQPIKYRVGDMIELTEEEAQAPIFENKLERVYSAHAEVTDESAEKAKAVLKAAEEKAAEIIKAAEQKSADLIIEGSEKAKKLVEKTTALAKAAAEGKAKAEADAAAEAKKKADPKKPKKEEV